MEFDTKTLDWAKAGTLVTKSDCLVIGLFESQTLAGTTKALDAATKGLVVRLVKLGDFEDKRGASLLLYEMAGVGTACALLVDLGKGADFTDHAYAEVVRIVLHALASTKATNVTWTLTEHTARNKDAAWAVLTAVTLIREVSYRFIERHPELKGRRDKDGTGLCKLVLAVPAADTETASVAAIRGTVITNGMDPTHDLGNLPSNICTPTYLANIAHQIAKDFKLKVEILSRRQIETLKMGVFLAMTKGNVEPPAFIALRYEGGPAKQVPVVLVGKSTTLDTDGISLKPGEGMGGVKHDMYSVTSVLDILRAVVGMGFKQNVIAVALACENMPGGITTKPGDVVTSMSSQTIEILDTDVEGCLILCDVLACVERFKPTVMINVVTLTGACIIALSYINTGMYARNDALADMLIATDKQSLNTAWCVPLDGEYRERLKPNFMDTGNIDGHPTGNVTITCFLARLTKKYDQTRLDIVGMA